MAACAAKKLQVLKSLALVVVALPLVITLVWPPGGPREPGEQQGDHEKGAGVPYPCPKARA